MKVTLTLEVAQLENSEYRFDVTFDETADCNAKIEELPILVMTFIETLKKHGGIAANILAPEIQEEFKREMAVRIVELSAARMLAKRTELENKAKLN